MIDAHSDGKVVIGASAGDSTIATPFPAADVRQWADSTARLLARRVPKSAKERDDFGLFQYVILIMLLGWLAAIDLPIHG